MLQFYFLSILLNAIAGIVILLDNKESLEPESERSFPSYISDETFRLVLGVLVCVTGFFKLLSPVRGDVPLVGDIVPALTGLFAGAIFLLEFYQTRSTTELSELPVIVQKIFSLSRYIGIAAISSAILHFLFPSVLLL